MPVIEEHNTLDAGHIAIGEGSEPCLDVLDERTIRRVSDGEADKTA